MTTKQAKKLSLEVWRYLAKHPEIDFKWKLPDKLYRKTHRYLFNCPLCHLFIGSNGCIGCPLKVCNKRNAFFYKWQNARKEKTRKKYAQEIVDTIEAWEPA